MPDDGSNYKYKFVYDPSMKEVGVVFTSDKVISAEEYIKMLEAWLLFCKQSLHEMFKDRPQLENDINLN